MYDGVLAQQRQSCRLDWAQSSWKRWPYVAFWWWIQPILSIGNKRSIVEDDLSDLSPDDQCSCLLSKINVDNDNWPGTWPLIIWTFRKDFLLIVLILLFYLMTRIGQPLLLRQIVLYVGAQSASFSYVGYLSAIGLGACSTLQAILHQQFFFRSNRIGIRIRHTLSAIIYKRLLMINTASFQHTTAAQTINLVANDATKFEELSIFIHYVWETPVESILTFGLIWWNIGLPMVFGYTVLFLLVPMQLAFGRKFSRYRKITMAHADRRVQTINELINGCQIIKMYNWEKTIEHRIYESRRSEFASIFNSSRLRALNLSISYSFLPLVSLVTFGGSWLVKRPLTAAQLFTALAFFSMLRAPITIFLPFAIEKLSEARVAAKRIDAFMQLGVLQDQRTKRNTKNKDYAIVMENASFSWTNSPNLFSLNLKIKHGMFVGVKGAVGAGKSSFLAAILGEINFTSGKYYLNCNTISYASQTPWIFSDTIRANILLGKAMNEERYKNVIWSCCLDTDLCVMGPSGDLTMIGDKGVNLSGGQRARISLARALYVDADIYLLDDPLAAVDPKVAKKIFDRCIGSQGLLSGKTRVLVTHQTHFLVEADKTILLTNGYIDEAQFEQSHTNNSVLDVTDEVDSSSLAQSNWSPHTVVTDKDAIIKNETSIDGAVKWNIWLRLFTAPPLNWFGLSLLVFIMFVSQALYDTTNRWLAIWSAKSNQSQRSSLGIFIYCGLVLCTLTATLLRTFFFFYIVLCGSNYFHDRMVNGILYTSLNFFASNPGGRVLNRASRDQHVIDESLPLALLDATQAILLTLGAIVIIGIINPWVLLVLIPLIPSFWWLRRFYLRSSRQLKRLESATRSPVYALFSSSLDGLMTIRAFNVKDDFVHLFMERMDANLRAYFTFNALVRWFGLRLDLMISILTLVTSILSVALHDRVDSGAVALSLTYCINLTALFQWGVRQSAEAENFMTSAERIYEYGKLMSEDDTHRSQSKVLIESPVLWPAQGIIEFKNYTFRYRPELKPALNNISLRIESNEKIGIIGRTGIISSLAYNGRQNCTTTCRKKKSFSIS